MTECRPGEEGEIWVAGPSVARGYWCRSDETERTFGGRLSKTGEGPYLRTGDLGRIIDSELFITGRIKDLIVIRGLNHYPQDIENTAERSDASLRPGCGAAFSVEGNGEERLVVVQEMEASQAYRADDVISLIREAVASEHDIQLYGLQLIGPGSLPKTSSGKVQRRACRDLYLENQLPVIAEWRDRGKEVVEPHICEQPGDHLAAPGTPLADDLLGWLQSYLARKFGADVQDIDITRSLMAFGLDSLAVLSLAHELESEFHIKTSVSDLYESRSIARLARELGSQLNQGEPGMQLRATPRTSDRRRLSFGQRGIWFEQQKRPDSSAYNIVRAARVHGPLNMLALRQAFQVLLDRHDCLRASISLCEGEPLQFIPARRTILFQEIDATGCDAQQVNQLTTEAARRCFEMSQGPLIRVFLIADQGNPILILTVHHIIADLWSLATVLNELESLYDWASSGTRLDLAPLTHGYGDYVAWQAQFVGAPAGERSLSYWSQRLSGELPILQFPADKLRPAIQSYRGAHRTFRLDSRTMDQLRFAARQLQTTAFALLVAGLRLVLYRYSGQEEVLIGTPASGRTRPEWRTIVGYFVNPVVLRLKVRQVWTVSELIQDAGRALVEALEHQDFPFPLIVEGLHPVRDLSRSPLFQVMLAFQKNPFEEDRGFSLFALGEPGQRLPLGPLELELVGLENQSVHLDLSVMIAEAADGLICRFEYDQGVLDATTIERLGGGFVTALQAMASQWLGRIAELPLITDRERAQMIEEWNATRRPFAEGLPVYRLVELRAERTPDAIALVCGDEQVSLRHLNRLSNRLANALRSRNVGRDSRIGICLHRSIQMVIAMLGVLKAGSAYVPLDPAHPLDRRVLMVANSGTAVVLSCRGLIHRMTTLGVPVLEVVTEAGPVDATCDHDPEPVVVGQNLAYVIYTSGTTGSPKGVMVTHRNLANLFDGLDLVIRDGSDGAWLAVTNFSFDISIVDLLWALKEGLRVVLGLASSTGSSERDVTQEQGVQAGPESLVSDLARHGVSHLQCTPSLAGVLVTDHESVTPLGALRLLLLGGEEPPDSLTQELNGLVGGTINNLYGPTETTVYSTSFRLGPGASHALIGRPIANTSVYILDQFIQPLPPGLQGELCIAGEGVARGYLGAPDLTSERFIPDPFSEVAGARMYRTGDLGRFIVDGNIDFLGRIDNQVKIRGHRVELGEVEYWLSDHPAVRQAAVVCAEGSGEQSLVAYVVGETGAVLDRRELKDFLGSKLPGYMVPSMFVVLDQLPLSTSGKVNRGLLRISAPMRVSGEASSRMPSGLVEELLATLWSELLDQERICADEDFFELGGHSLLATRLIYKIRSCFGVEIPIQEIFARPTIAALSELITRDLSAVSAQPETPLLASTRSAPLPLSFSQRRLWFLNQLSPASPTYDIAVGFRLDGVLNKVALEQSLREVIRRHEILRTVFPAVNGTPLQQILPEPVGNFPLTDLQGLQGDKAEHTGTSLINDSPIAPFNLEHGPLIRGGLFKVTEGQHMLALAAHHIICDGWSLIVLFREIRKLYEDFSAGESSTIPELAFQYGDFSEWQHLTERPSFESNLAYWRMQLTGAAPVLNLVTDHPRPPLPTWAGARQPVSVSSDLFGMLGAICRRRGATLYVVLLAAFQVLLYRYSGQEDVLVGSPIANRTRPEFETLIGLFVNTIVMRTKVEPQLTSGQIVARVREIALGAYAHQELPLEIVVEGLNPDRKLSHSPLFQVMFALMNAGADSIGLPGLNECRIDTDNRTAKFDLSLELIEGRGGLRGALEYSTDLFEAVTIQRMAGHFLRVVQAFLEPAELRVSDVSILSEEELHQLTFEWSGYASAGPSGLNIEELFSAWVQRSPDALAVCVEDEHISRYELEVRSNKLARYLRRRKVALEMRLGICLERSIEMMVAILGTVKVGACYVPLDPSIPNERLNFIVSDAEAYLVITERRALGRFASDARTLCVDAESSAIDRESADGLADGAAEGNLVYVVYTSGSTGRPKGVAIEHRGLVNLVQWFQGAYGVGASDRGCQLAGPGFDACAWEIWSYLTGGASLWMCSEETRVSLDRLSEWLVTRGITMAFLSTPLAEAALSGDALADSQLRFLFTGGDKLVHYPRGGLPFQLVNLYGPSECSVISTWARIAPKAAADGAPSIGGPIDEAQIYLLDDQLHPVPIGAIGEICIVGSGLGRGYVNNPGITAESFLPDPFSAFRGGRIYRTGDLGRHTKDGTIDILGRSDEQIKIRGFRIEPEEVELALSRHPSVNQAIVGPYESRTGGRQLAAYVVAGESHKPSPPELESFLKLSLPNYMVPSVYVMLDALPLTPNGKIDRRALPAPEPNPAADGDSSLCRTPIEKTVAGIWASVLELDELSAARSFFELGGHSLLATQIVSRVRDTFQIEVSLSEFLQEPTVRGLACVIGRKQVGSREEDDVEVAPIPRGNRRLGDIVSELERGAAPNGQTAERTRGT
jgi:amino acid adenylation domain-containing protein